MADPSDQFSWLNGVFDWYQDSPIPQWGDNVLNAIGDSNDWATETAVGLAAPYFAPHGDRMAGQADMAATIGQNVANMAVQGVGAIPATAMQMKDPNVGFQEALSNSTNAMQNNMQQYGRQPSTGMGQYMAGALSPVGEQWERGKRFLGDTGQDMGASPELSTALYMAPELATLGASRLFGSAKPRQFTADDLFPQQPRLGGRADPFKVEGITGRGGPGKYEEGAVKVKGRDSNNVETYEPFENKTIPSTPLFDFPEINNFGNTSTPVKGGGALFSSEIPEALRNIQRKKGSGADWEKEFKRLGINRDQLNLSGLIPLLNDPDKNITRDDIGLAYGEAKDRGTGAVWTSGDNVDPRRPPEFDQSAYDTKMEAYNQASSDITTLQEGLLEDVDEERISGLGALPGNNANLVMQSVRDLVDDGSFRSNNGWRFVADGDEGNRLNEYHTWLVDSQGMSEADAADLVDSVGNLHEARRITRITPTPIPQNRAIPGPAGNDDYTYKTQFKYPGSLYDQRWAYQLPDAYGQAEFGQMPYSHFSELRDYGMDPSYEEGGPTVPWSHNRAGAYPVMSEPTWKDDDGNTMRATTMDIYESQFDPPSHTGYDLTNVHGQMEQRRGPRKPKTDETHAQLVAARDKINALTNTKDDIHGQWRQASDEASQIAGQLPYELRNIGERVKNSLYDYESSKIDDKGLATLRPYGPSAQMSANILAGGKGISELPEKIQERVQPYVNQVAEALTADPDKKEAFNQYLNKIIEVDNLYDKQTELGHEIRKVQESEVQYLENIDRQFLPDMFPLTDDWSKRMLPHLGMSLDQAIKQGHEFLSWSTQRGQGEAYNRIYSKVGPEQEATDKFIPKRKDVGYKGDQFIDLDTGQPIQDVDQIPEDTQAILRNAPIQPRTMSEDRIRQRNYSRLESEIDDAYVNNNRLVYEELAIVDSETGTRYDAEQASRYDIAQRLYFEANPDQLWDTQQLIDSGEIKAKDWITGASKRVNFAGGDTTGRMSNPDEGVLEEFGGKFIPDDAQRRLYGQTNPLNSSRDVEGVHHPSAVGTRGAAKRYYDRDFVEGNMRKFLRSLGLNDAQIEEAVQPIDVGISSDAMPGRKQNRPAIRVTEAVKKAWENRPTGGIWGYRPIPSKKPKGDKSKPNPGKIMGAFKQGKLDRAQAEQQLLDAGVPADRIGNMLR